MLWERTGIGRGECRQKEWKRQSLKTAQKRDICVCVCVCVHASAYACAEKEGGGVFTWRQQGWLIRKSSLLANGF